MTNTKHTDAITQFYSFLLNKRKEKCCLYIQNPPAKLPFPLLQLCFTQLFIHVLTILKSIQKSELSGKFHFISNIASCYRDNTACLVTLPEVTILSDISMEKEEMPSLLEAAIFFSLPES